MFINTKEVYYEIYPLSVQEIAKEQCIDKTLCKYFTKDSDNDKYCKHMVNKMEVLVSDGTRLVIPSKFQRNFVAWYQHYLHHPGQLRLEETIKATMYWGML